MSDKDNEGGSVTIKDVKLPYILRDKIIFSPGVHNGFKYTEDSIRKGYQNTQWSSRTQSLYHAHKDEFAVNPETGNRDVHVGAEIDDYAGSIKNITYEGKGVIRGDIYIWDLNTALKMMGGAKVGISPAGKIKPNTLGEVEDMVIYNWAVTVNPAIKTTFINSEEHWTNCFAMSEEIIEKMDNKDEDKKDEGEGVSNSNAETKMKELAETVGALSDEIKALKAEKDKEVEVEEEASEDEEDEDDEDEDEGVENADEEVDPEEEARKKKKDEEDKAALAEIVKEAGKLSEGEAKVLNEKIKVSGLSEGKRLFDLYLAGEKVKMQASEVTLLKEEVNGLRKDLKEVKQKPESVLNLPALGEGKTEYGLTEVEDGMLKYLQTVSGQI